MKATAIFRTGIMALCMAMACGSCVVYKDRPPGPEHHKKPKPHHKDPKPPKPHHLHGQAGQDNCGGTYYAWNVSA